MRQKNTVNGWINLNKPLNMTSTQAVGKIKHILNAKKAGHAGTLDPLATGVLPIALGEATKTLCFAQESQKGYQFTITWGETRDTDDGEGAIIATSDNRPSKQAILDAIPRFIGNIEQIPPQYSAVKIQGERAYDLARNGVEFTTTPRLVHIYSLELTAYTEHTASFEMTCGKGTYVRALARDLSSVLGTCGYISALNRNFVGSFTQDHAISLDKLTEIVDSADAHKAILPIVTVLDDIPALPLSDQETSWLRNGQKLVFSARPDIDRLQSHGIDPLTAKDLIVLAVGNNGEKPLGLVRMNGVSMKPERLFNL